ncbi:MAG: gamma-glutamyl-gamma-aminobutyrate hydrolase family protein [Calditrichaeota bacterium]|nr:gamma-glutamyl-gamma-aminobutyrate hydrolase family protein [Calditrichota bacterium]
MKPLIGISANMSPPNDPKRTFSTSVKVHYLHDPYCQFILAGGGIPVVLPPVESPDAAPAIVAGLNGILISGGCDVDPAFYGESNHASMNCDPARDRFEMELVKAARGLSRAVLGICRGMQVINVAFGGSLYQDVPTEIEGALQHHNWEDGRESFHSILLTRHSPLSEVLERDEIQVNSSHHQSIKDLGRGLVPLAAANDGVIEAVHCPDDRFTFGVQWHPERMLGEAQMVELSRWFVRNAAQ